MKSISQKIVVRIESLKQENKKPLLIVLSEKLDAQLRQEMGYPDQHGVTINGTLKFQNLPVFIIPTTNSEFYAVVEDIGE